MLLTFTSFDPLNTTILGEHDTALYSVWTPYVSPKTTYIYQGQQHDLRKTEGTVPGSAFAKITWHYDQARCRVFINSREYTLPDFLPDKSWRSKDRVLQTSSNTKYLWKPNVDVYDDKSQLIGRFTTTFPTTAATTTTPCPTFNISDEKIPTSGSTLDEIVISLIILVRLQLRNSKGLDGIEQEEANILNKGKLRTALDWLSDGMTGGFYT